MKTEQVQLSSALLKKLAKFKKKMIIRLDFVPVRCTRKQFYRVSTNPTININLFYGVKKKNVH